MYKKIREVLPIVIIGLSMLIAITSILTVLKTSNDDAIMTGLTAIFGGEVAALGSFASVDVNFSLFNFLAFYLPVIVALLIFFMGRKTKLEHFILFLLSVLLTATFIGSIVIISNLGAYTQGTATLLGIETTYTYEGAKLALGSIISLILAILGALSSALLALSQFKK